MSNSKKTDHGVQTINRRKFMQVSAVSTAMMMGEFAFPWKSWSADGNILRVRLYSDIATLDPAFIQSYNDDIVCDCLQSRLISFKPGDKWEWELSAAEYIKHITPTRIEFKLKEGIMFSNGFGEMTTEDVKYSFERIANPKTKSPYQNDWNLLDKVEIIDKYRGALVLKEASAPLWMTSLPGSSGTILSKKAMMSVEEKFTTMPPACSGPYILKKWEPKQMTVVVRNPDWNGPKPDFEEVHFYPIDDEKTAEIGFEAGDLDFTRISVSSYEMFKSKPSADSTVVNKPSLYYAWLGINRDNPMLTDLRVRKAVQLATDIDSILEAAYFGMAEPATGIIPPGVLGHREKSIIPPRANPKEARKLLAEAGYPKGIDLTLDTLNKSAFITQAQVIQASLAEAGIRVKINVHESGQFWVLGDETEMKEKVKDIQLITNRFAAYPDPSYYSMSHVSEQVGVWNWERFANEEFDKLHDQAMIESDPAKRGKMYQKMQDLMEESGCYRFITHESAPTIYRNSIVPAMTPDGIPLVRHFKKA